MQKQLERNNKFHNIIVKSSFSEHTLELIKTRAVKVRTRIIKNLYSIIRYIFWLSILVGLSYLALQQIKYIIFNTAYFEVANIEVIGNRELTKDEIVKVTGISIGSKIYNLDLNEISSKVSQIAYVKNCFVRYSGLNNVKIYITERNPYFYLKSINNLYEISDDGIILKVNPNKFRDLPIFSGFREESLKEGDSVASENIYNEAKIFMHIMDRFILDNISEINYSNLYSPYIYLRNGIKIYFRNLTDLKDRFAFFTSVLDNLLKSNVKPEYLDLRNPKFIVYKPQR